MYNCQVFRVTNQLRENGGTVNILVLFAESESEDEERISLYWREKDLKEALSCIASQTIDDEDVCTKAEELIETGSVKKTLAFLSTHSDWTFEVQEAEVEGCIDLKVLKKISEIPFDGPRLTVVPPIRVSAPVKRSAPVTKSVGCRTVINGIEA
jgi:hypothetical protein